MIIPGIVSATFRDKSAEEIIRLCREAKLQAIEWSENAHVFPGETDAAEELYHMTVNAGLQVAAYGSYYRLGQQEAERIEEVFLPTLEAAAALRAPLIRIWAGTEGSAEVSEEKRMVLAEEAWKVCELAAQKNIKIALEWHKKTLTDTNESAFRFLKEVGHPNLYCLWQPTVALSMEQRIEGLADLKDRLLNLHIYYWEKKEKRPLREGIQEWRQYLAHVDKETDRFGLLEFVKDNLEEQFLEDAAVLREEILV